MDPGLLNPLVFDTENQPDIGIHNRQSIQLFYYLVLT